MLGENGLVEIEEICHVDETSCENLREYAKLRGITSDEADELEDLGHSPITGLWRDRGRPRIYR